MNRISVSKDEIIELLGLRISGNRGWYIGKCVFCGKEGKMGINFDDLGFNCFAGKCQKSGSLLSLLKYIGRTDLISSHRTISNRIMESDISRDKIIDINLDTPEVKKPIGFKRVDYHPYLDKRGFTDYQYSIFNVGVTTLDPKYRDYYVIFLVMEDNKCVGHLGRRTISDEEVGLLDVIIPKYNNSNTDFGMILMGLDEIIVGVTDTIVLVEGVTDKASVDRNLGLYDDDEMACCCSFGKRISHVHIAKLYIRGVKNIYMFYDPDAVKQTRKYADDLSLYFNVRMVNNINATVDAGAMNANEMIERFENSVDIVTYYTNAIL